MDAFTKRNHYNPCFWTALWNASYFESRLREAASQSARSQPVFALSVQANKVYPTTVENVHFVKDLGVAEITPATMKSFCKRRFPEEYDKLAKHVDEHPQSLYMDFEDILSGIERVGGYRNVDVASGQDSSGPPIRAYVDLAIHEPEAAVIREIADRYVNGEGLKTIAHRLNDKNAPSPRAQLGRPSGWSPSTVREVLRRPLYRALKIWNKTRKRDASGGRKHSVRPESEWRVVERPDLQILSAAIIGAIDAKMASHQERGVGQKGRKPGNAGRGNTKYLLAGGLLKCRRGGNFEVAFDYKLQDKAYVCSTRRRKGPKACQNSIAVPIDMAEGSVLRVLHGQVLEPTFVDQVMRLAFESRVTGDDRRPALEAERVELTADVDRLKRAIRKTDDDDAMEILVGELNVAARRLKAVDQQLAVLAEPLDNARLRAALEQRIANWREVLRSSHKAEVRLILTRLLGSVTFYFEDPAQLETADGADDNDRRGKENLTLEDCGWIGSVNPAGFVDLFHDRMASPRGPGRLYTLRGAARAA